MELDDLRESQRYKNILNAIVHEYIKTGKPVGSRSIAKKMNFRFSPATIRNIMADLEEMGYIYQPHTSAGRVPTDKGYRFYVSTLMEVRELTLRERHKIEQEFEEKISEIDKVLRVTSQLLAMSSRKIGMITEPFIPQSKLEFIGLGKLGSKKVLMTIVTDSGLIKNRLVYCAKEYSNHDLEVIQKILNYELGGLNFMQIQEKVNEEFTLKYMKELKSEALIDDVVSFAIGVLQSKDEFPNIYIEGTKNYLMYIEDADELRGILSIVDDREKFEDIFIEPLEKNGLNILIGNEIKHSELKSCSIITSTYKIGGRSIGTLGIIGPKRMEYSKMVSLVSYVAEIVSRIMSRLGGEYK